MTTTVLITPELKITQINTLITFVLIWPDLHLYYFNNNNKDAVKTKNYIVTIVNIIVQLLVDNVLTKTVE